MKIKKTTTSKTKKLIIILLTITIAAAGYLTYAKLNATWPFSDKPEEINQDSNDSSEESTNQHPINEHNDQSAKERLIEEPETIETNDSTQNINNFNQVKEKSSSNAGQNKKVVVTVGVSFVDMYKDNLEIRAFTPSIVQGTGQCTATVTKSGSSTVTKRSSAFVDTSSTICEPIYIPKSSLSKGRWNVVVTYESPTHKGSSGSHEVEVK